MRVVEAFEVPDQRVGVFVDGQTRLPIKTKLTATIVRPDGSSVSAEAGKEFAHGRTPTFWEREVFLLSGLSKADVPIGSEIEVVVAAQPAAREPQPKTSQSLAARLSSFVRSRLGLTWNRP